MYYADKQAHKHKKFRKRFWWTVTLIIAAALLYWLLNLRVTPQQNVRNTPPLSRPYNSAVDKKVVFTKPELTFETANGWEEVPITQTVSSPRYVFRNKSQAKILEIYIDNPPQGFGINKAIVVGATNATLVHDVVSENCTTFTGNSDKGVRPGLSPAKWQEVDFQCDMANPTRAVVGTISKDGLNYFNVVTSATKTYKVFITYTDNNINPDYNTLYEIIESMRFR